MTKISVVVSCYNYGHFLDEAVQSLVNQTRKPFEVVIADDCSSDDTEEKGLAWAKIPPILYNKNETNLGVVRNLDKNIKQTTGDYIVHLDGDNRMRPTYLEELAAVLDAKPEIGIVYTDCAVFGVHARGISGNSTWWRNRREEGVYLIWEYFDFDRNILRRRNYMHGSSMYRRVCYDQAGGYEVCRHPNRAEDYALWYQIVLEKGWDAYYVKKPLLEYRQHSQEQRSIKQPGKP